MQAAKMSSTQDKKKITLLEIILNVFNILQHDLFWLQHHFCLFQLASSVNLLCWQICWQNLLCCIFYCLLRKIRCTLLLEGTDVYNWQHIYQKDITHCLSLYQYVWVIHKKQDCQTNCFVSGPPKWRLLIVIDELGPFYQ